MDFTDFTAGKNDNDRRIDKIARLFIKDASLSEIYKALRKGLIKINKKKCKPETHVFQGDIISIADLLLKTVINENSLITKDSIDESDIIFENSDLLVINKPYNVNVHGDENSIDKLVLNYLQNRIDDSSLSFKPGPLHRIDKKTTGLLCFSKSINGARWFTENLQNHNISKTYYAILQGAIQNKEIWNDVINNENEMENGFFKVTVTDKSMNIKSKQAVTEVTPLAYGSYKDLQNLQVTFCKIKISTGRKHQIRAQSSFHKHPLIGDTAYGGIKIPDSKQDFYLHAGLLQFPENPFNITENLYAELPDAFIDFLKYCEINKFAL